MLCMAKANGEGSLFQAHGGLPKLIWSIISQSNGPVERERKREGDKFL